MRRSLYFNATSTFRGPPVKLQGFKERLQKENVVNFFKSPNDLRAHVINTLSHHREPNPVPFHYVSDIPAPPEVYVAHPYTLLRTGKLIGRQPELNELTEWATKSSQPVFTVVAIGGMGKSALTGTGSTRSRRSR